MAFILDTVTVSELRKGERTHLAVRSWHKSISDEPAYLSVITANEIRFGIRKLETRDRIFAELLERWYSKLITQPEIFVLLDVTLPIAEMAADFRGIHNLSYNDSLIAATASVHGLTIATRNTADFEKTGIRLFNPWGFQP